MTISHLFDHEAVVWRKAETLNASGVTHKDFSLLYGPLGCKANRKAAVVANAGPGIVDAGQRVFYLEVGPVILKRDLFELTSGPDAPAILEVENVTIPRGHHIEVRCSEYHGPLPDPGS